MKSCAILKDSIAQSWGVPRLQAITSALEISGSSASAMSLGVANKFLEPYAGAVLGKIVLLVVVILFIQKRPRGLFALKGRAVEA